MTSSMRLALVAVCMFAFTFSVGSNTALATPIDLDKQAKALSILADFADRVCSQVKDYGSASDYLATVDAKAQLDGLSKKFVDLGISLNGMYTGHSFQNVAQVDLPKAMEVSSNCKLEIVKLYRQDFIVQACTQSRTVVFTPDTPGVMQMENGHRVDLGDGGGGTRFEKWQYTWSAPDQVTSVNCMTQRNEHVLGDPWFAGNSATCAGSINGGNDAMTMNVTWLEPCDRQI